MAWSCATVPTAASKRFWRIRQARWWSSRARWRSTRGSCTLDLCFCHRWLSTHYPPNQWLPLRSRKYVSNCSGRKKLTLDCNPSMNECLLTPKGCGHLLTAVTSHDRCNFDCLIFPQRLKSHPGTHNNFGWQVYPTTSHCNQVDYNG